jgi:hypothetical protein
VPFSVHQVTVGTAGTSLLTNLPPGPAAVTLSNINNSTLYIGPGTGVSSTAGFPIPASTPSFTLNFPAMAFPQAALYGISSAGTTNTVGVSLTSAG